MSSCEVAQWVPLLLIVIMILVGIIFNLWWVFVTPKERDDDLERNMVPWGGEIGASSSSSSLSLS